MEASTNKLPSPTLNRPRPNPSSRNAETNISIRRSFKGDPFARSADLRRRKTIGFDEKENENKISVARVSSPGKLKKNFMAPTISAASKVTPSPRKRVLTEKNDSISSSENRKFSFTKETESDLHSEMEAGEKKIHLVKQDDDRCIQETSVSDLVQDECIEVPSNSEHSSLSLSNIDETDPDRSFLPPYDPTTNYLSPRPLFLRYKPNPRVEVFLSKQVLDLKESLKSESLSSDDTQSAYTGKESYEDTELGSSIVFSEPVYESKSSLVFAEPVYQYKNIHKHDFYKTGPRKSISLLLIFLITCLCISVTDSPVIGSRIFDQTMYNSDYPFDRENCDWFVRNWKITHFSKSDELRKPIRFSNTSSLEREAFLVNLYLFNEDTLNGNQEQNGLEIVMKDEESDLIESLIEEQTEGSPDDDEDLKRIEDPSGVESQACDIILKQGELEKSVDADSLRQEEACDNEISTVSNESDLNSEKESADNVILTELFESEPSLEEETIDSEILIDVDDPKLAPANEISTDPDKFELHSENEAADYEIPTESNEFVHNLEEKTFDFDVSREMDDPKLFVEETIRAHNVVSASVLVLGFIVSGSMFLSTKKQSKATPIVKPSSSFAVKKTIGEEKSASTYSQMSSFESTRTSEEESRRESLASSDFSMGSPSYGSFTTYERIPRHPHGSGDEDIVTPVRRSSRIRSKVVSCS